jgi:RNA polymerase sigma factor (sigma-70 family)
MRGTVRAIPEPASSHGDPQGVRAFFVFPARADRSWKTATARSCPTNRRQRLAKPLDNERAAWDRKVRRVVPPESSSQDRWFTEHVLPHEPMLRAWLRGHFSKAGDVDDIVQEAYVRMLEARRAREIVSPRAFLFATARNLALGRLRHLKVEADFALAESSVWDVSDESADVAQAVARAQELELLTEAIQSLPARCRQVITLRRIYGLPQKEVAARLGISEHTVEAQATIGLRKLGEFFERLERRTGAP